ncbi:type II secretion system major pseudopilin GspG [Gammaproteobacteria bacterium]|nr:type II secretion system major pseudopilin GspG [Gammaproteobacteria bacterium]
MSQLTRQRRARQGGFTLLEIIIVLLIIGLLAAVVAPNLFSRVDDARETKSQQDISTLEASLKLYRLDNFSYPSTQQGLRALVEEPSAEPKPKNWDRYIDRLPDDPWGNPYQYRNPGKNGDVDIFSFGADGREGGTDNNADIGNWQLR